MKRWPGFLCVLLTVLLVVLAGCAPPPREERGEVIKSDNGGFPKEAVDYAGRSLHLEAPPESYASTLPSNTEILFALGLGDRVKAVTVYCDYPPEIEDKSMTLEDFDPDKIGEMVPELILAGEGQELFLDAAALVPGVSSFILAPRKFDEVVESIRLVGEITGREEEASRVAREMAEKKKKVSELSSQLQPSEQPDVLVLVSPAELEVAGKGTIVNELLEIAGSSNAAGAEEGYYSLDEGELMQLDPEIIIALGPWEEGLQEESPGENRRQGLQAFSNERVYRMEAALLTRPGPRLGDGLEELFGILHGS